MAPYNDSLGVVIPTYRRPELLRGCVRSVIDAAAPFHVPIFLADDSTDDTNRAVVDELRRAYDAIVYVRNERNLGIDRNILKSIGLCDCAYAWPIGEDDLMRPEAVEHILGVLEHVPERPAFVFANYTSVNEDYSRILRERVLQIDEDAMASSEEFLRRWAWAIGFIGGCVVNRDLWDKVDPTPYLGTYFAHVGVILESIRQRPIRMVSTPLVLNRAGSAQVFTWSGSTYDVLAGWGRLMQALAPVYGEAACREGSRSFERAHGLTSLRFLVYARAEGLLDDAISHHHAQSGGVLYRAAAWGIARLPRRWAKLILDTGRALRRRGMRLTGSMSIPTPRPGPT